MNCQRRLDGLQQEMRKKNIDLVLYGSCPNFQYLTGIQVNWRLAPDLQPPGDIMLVPQYGEPVLIISGNYTAASCSVKNIHQYDQALGYMAMLDSTIKGLSIEVRKLALGSYLPIPAVTAAIMVTQHPELCDASNLMDHLRMIKEPEEVELLHKVAQLTDDVMMDVIGNIKDGISQIDLMLEIEMQARRMGATDVSFGPWACFVKSSSSTTHQVSKGQDDSGRISNYPLNQGLTSNTAITFDVGFVMNGYCSDWGRSVYWGTPSGSAKDAHAALRQSVVETVAELKDGSMRACDVYPAIEQKLDALGFGDQMRARLASHKIMGHQIGTEVHEDPWLKPDVDDTLRAGMVMCIEPKLWLAGEYYFRLEEMVHITKTGAEFLTNFDREMFVL
jgi:Xaa-Pro aminopeptidase